MTSQAESPRNLLIAQQLADELGELERFIALLLEEQTVLQAGAADKLIPLADKKSALALRLSQLLAEREAALTRSGFGTGRAGMESWLKTQSENSAQQDVWEHLLTLAEKARDQQEINGKLIAIQMQHTQQALTALMSASGRPLTYGPDGQQRLGGGSRTFGSA